MGRDEDENRGTRRLAIVVSALLYIIAGLPFWWKLTEMYRAPLPYRDVEEFATKLSASEPRVGCQLRIVFMLKEAILDQEVEWSSRLEEVLEATRDRATDGNSCELDVDATLDAKDVCLRKGQGVKPLWQCGRYSWDEFVVGDDHVRDESLRKVIVSEGGGDPGMYTILVLVGGELGENRVVGRHRHGWINFPKSLLEDSEQLVGSICETATVLLGTGRAEKTLKPMPLAADGSAILSFSLLNANPDDWIFNWDFDSVESRYLSPIVDALAPVARLSVESQILYYTPAAAKSHWNAKTQSNVIASKDLSFFVNANEWHLDTSTAAAGRSKVIHVAIYVPPVSECPLHIKLSGGRLTSSIGGFTSPVGSRHFNLLLCEGLMPLLLLQGWGGVVIWNPPGCLVSSNSSFQLLNVNDVKMIVEVVVAQVRTLFGLPPVPKSPRITILLNERTGFSEWEVDLMLRRRVIADVNSTASTLSSLLKLVESLPKMVIQEEIGVQVKTSLAAAEKAIHSPIATYEDISEFSATARAYAEAAFFHPSIMSLLHFPKEHQFAIYTPFFVPVLLHTLISVVKETRRYIKRRP